MLCRSRQKNPLLSPTHTLLLHLLILLAGAAPPAETSSAVNSLSPAAPAARPPSTLDPKQLTALQSMGLSVGRDPCGNPSPHDNATACDSSSPFRHLISLRLANCSPDLDLSPTALRSLHTLRSLSFFRCPIPPIKHFPPPLASALRSFSCISSLRPLPALLLSHLRNLTLLSVKDVPISDSSPFLIFSQMHNLCSATISNASLSGQLPRHWHSISLTHLDLSSNALKGPVPGSISLLESLEFLNLSSNSLSGPLPDAIGDLIFLKTASFARNSLSGPIPETMAALPELAQLDLSYNQFNESIPRFLSEMSSLKHLNLESNNFQGVIPFNASFIERLEVFKVSGNGNLCYNRSVLSSKLMLGIAPCDKYGLPVPPPPGKADRDDSFSDYDYGGEDDGGGGDGKGGGGRHGVNRLVLGVAIGLSCLVFLLIFLVCLSKLWA